MFLPLSVCEPGVNHGKSGAGPPDENGSAGAPACFLGLGFFSAESPGWVRA